MDIFQKRLWFDCIQPPLRLRARTRNKQWSSDLSLLKYVCFMCMWKQAVESKHTLAAVSVWVCDHTHVCMMDHSQKGKEGQSPPSGLWHPLSFPSSLLLLLLLYATIHLNHRLSHSLSTQSQLSLMSLLSNCVPVECTLGLKWLLAVFWRDFRLSESALLQSAAILLSSWLQWGRWGAKVRQQLLPREVW